MQNRPGICIRLSTKRTEQSIWGSCPCVRRTSFLVQLPGTRLRRFIVPILPFWGATAFRHPFFDILMPRIRPALKDCQIITQWHGKFNLPETGKNHSFRALHHIYRTTGIPGSASPILPQRSLINLRIPCCQSRRIFGLHARTGTAILHNRS